MKTTSLAVNFLLWLFLSSLCHAASAESSPDVRKVYDCVRAESTPLIDGDVLESCWTNAPWASIGKSTVAANAVSPARARMLWDDVYLYFAAEISDATPRREYSERDAEVWSDDCFELYIAPSDEKRYYYELDMNSTGAVWDSIGLAHPEGRQQFIRNWNASTLEVKTKPRDGGWTVEGRIRLDEFIGAARIPPRHDSRWRVNFFYLDSSLDGKQQRSFSWNPTERFNDISRFGVLQFTDWKGNAKDQQAQALAQWLMNTDRLKGKETIESLVEGITVYSKATGGFKRNGGTWNSSSGLGKVSTSLSTKAEPAYWQVRPNAGDDPTLIDFIAPRDGVLVLLGRLSAASMDGIEHGEADGAWLHSRSENQNALIHLRDTQWRATTLDVKQGKQIRIEVDAGPAGNFLSDSPQIAAFLVEQKVLRPDLPQNWQALGATGLTHQSTPADARDNEQITVIATDHFTGARREIPATLGARLYKIMGKIRRELVGTTRAHVGIDYLDKAGKFIRQATTREPLYSHLRWGLANFSGAKDWEPFVAYAYHVPPETAALSLWIGVNAWEAPDAAGRASFSDIKVEAVPFDEKYPLGFPPLKWVSPQTPAKPKAKDGYIVLRTSTTRYQLPQMPPARNRDDKVLDVLAWPSATTSASFSVHAAKTLDDVRVTVSDLALTTNKKIKLPASQIDVRKVRYLYRKRDKMITNQYLLSPNHLEKFASFSVAENQSQQIWITLRALANTPPGRYEGTITIAPINAKRKTLRLLLQVLPIEPQMRPGVLMGLYSYYNRADTPEDLRAMLRDMKAHGMTTTFQFNDDLIIPIECEPSGRVVIRWDQKNQLRELFETYHDTGFTEPLMIIAPQAFYDAAEKFGGDEPGIFGAGYINILSDLFVQVKEYGRKHRWPEFQVAPYDEGYPYPMSDTRFKVMRAGVAALQKAGVPAALHSLNHPAAGGFKFEREFEDETDVILQTFAHPPATGGPQYRGYDSWKQYRDAMHSDGKRVLFYNADVTGVHPEAMRFAYGVGLWKTKADGMMNWHYYEHTPDGGYGLSKTQGAKVMNFTFPAMQEYSGGPTIGWEAAREGVKDYQLLYALGELIRKALQASDAQTQLKAKNARAQVEAILSRIRLDTIDPVGALSLGQWEHESVNQKGEIEISGEFKISNGLQMEDYDRLRETVCQFILQLSPKRM